MENKELLLHLLKRLDRGEICFKGNFWNDRTEFILCAKDEEDKEKIIIGVGSTNENYRGVSFERYNPSLNEKFKDNFYKEKETKCWVKDCPNKVLQKEGDCEKLKLHCHERHTRIVCKDCSESDYIHQLIDGVY